MGSPLKSIPIEVPFPIPPFVGQALTQLEKNGFLAYVVGGSVRDFLLGRKVKDHDLATDANPEQLHQLFPMAVIVGKAFGVLKIPTGQDPPFVEVATFRKDLEYRDFRHPQGVVFSTPQEDALRRDFSINALFYDRKNHVILDFVGGMGDLKKKIIRAIGVPQERFREDALRLLRAIRFGTRLDFKIEETTAKAIRENASLISKVSVERIREELSWMWIGPQPWQALAEMKRLELLSGVLPELNGQTAKLEGVWRQSAGWTGFKDEAFVWASLGLETGLETLQQLLERLKFSNTQREKALRIYSIYLRLKEKGNEIQGAARERLLRDSAFREGLELYRLVQISEKAMDFSLYQDYLHSWEGLRDRGELEIPKLIDGKDLIAFGLTPGPEFAKVLTEIEDLALEKKLSTKEQALAYLQSRQK